MVYLAGKHWASSGCCGSVSSFKAALRRQALTQIADWAASKLQYWKYALDEVI